jgi:hypothetical protein
MYARSQSRSSKLGYRVIASSPGPRQKAISEHNTLPAKVDARDQRTAIDRRLARYR